MKLAPDALITTYSDNSWTPPLRHASDGSAESLLCQSYIFVIPLSLNPV